MSTLPDTLRSHSPQLRLRPHPRPRRHRLSDENPADRQRFPDYTITHHNNTHNNNNNNNNNTHTHTHTHTPAIRRPNRSAARSGSLHDRSSMDGRQVFPDDLAPPPTRRPSPSLPTDSPHSASLPPHPLQYHSGPPSSYHSDHPPRYPNHHHHHHHHQQQQQHQNHHYKHQHQQQKQQQQQQQQQQHQQQQQSDLDTITPVKQWMTPAVVAGGYIVVDVTSDGSFGTILKAKRLSDDIWVAIKVVAKSRLSEKDTANIRKQAITLRTLRHRYIVHFYDDFEDNDYFYHVFEYLHGGDLYDRLESRGKPFSEAQVLFLARQLFYAVSYLHSKRAAHRDLKLENFVFETSPTDQRQVMKLIDFDLLVVRSRQSPRTETCSDICGTILYVSPEIASGREHVPEESDMWACGVMLYVLLSYHMPFQGSSGRQILRAVRSAEPHFGPGIWSHVSFETKQLVKDLLSKNAAERPTAEQALERVKMIQASSREPQSGSKLRALKRGLRSVSLNLWDNSGNLVRRGRVDSRGEDKYQNARRAHSNVPNFDDESSPSSSMRSSFVLHSQAGSDAASELEYASVSSRTRHSDRYTVERGSRGNVVVPFKQRPFESNEFLTSPALGAVLARRRAVLNHRDKAEMSETDTDPDAFIRSSRRFRKPSLGARLKNWMHLGGQS